MDLGEERKKRGTFEDDEEQDIYRVKQPKGIPVEIPERISVPLQPSREVTIV